MQRTFKQMNNQELVLLQQQGGALVDIRRAEEWALTGVVAGSLLLTFFSHDGQSDPADWLLRLNRQVPAEQPVGLICRSGYRTSLVGEFLLETTQRRDVYHLSEGILGWLAAGRAVTDVVKSQSD